MTRLNLAALSLALSLQTAGCATEDYVDEKVAGVETQAAHAQGTADAAQGTAAEALARANAAHKLAEGKFLYEEVVSDDVARFAVGSDELSRKARARLDQIADRLKAENRNVYLEIQGFTDNSGDTKLNQQLGQDRAETVMRYLHQRGVPLTRMAVISYGEESPVADNSTAEGRAANRRVKIIVLV